MKFELIGAGLNGDYWKTKSRLVRIYYLIGFDLKIQIIIIIIINDIKNC